MAEPIRTLGPYKLLRKIGRGAFGVVWLAERQKAIATTQFALKLPRDEDIDLEVFKQEAAIWVQAGGHENVVSLIEADIYDEQVFMVSEYVPDGSLATWLKQHGGKAPSIEAACEMIDGILAGLAHLHERRIIHRDLKPDNILLRRDTPRLADFGIARLLRSGSSSMTIAGTPAYMAPEAFDGKRNERTDIWAVGVIFYQLLVGQLPYPQQDYASFIGAIMRHDPPPLPDFVAEALRRVVTKALQRDRAQRYAAAAEMRHDLREAERLRWLKEHEAREVLPTLIKNRQSAAAGTPMTNKIGMEFVAIPAGEFTMGSDSNEHANEKPAHPVTISQPFYIGKYEVTQKQWQAVMGDSPSHFKGDDLPVEQVSWIQAQEFITKLNALNDGFTYRLPTEAEWEYACRATTTTGFSFGDSLSSAQANFDGSHPYGGAEKGVWRQTTTAVGTFKPNKFGLYDMHGNVWEWCEDWYHDNYNGAPTDGSAWLSGGQQKYRVLRGGSWNNAALHARSANRRRYAPDNRNLPLGFRVVVR